MRISDWSSDVCSSDLPVDRLLHGNNVGACFLYRARVTEALGGYDTGLFGVEDYDFWLRAARHFTFVTLHEDLYLYRKHGGSLTSRRAEHIQTLTAAIETGRESCRERVCQSV